MVGEGDGSGPGKDRVLALHVAQDGHGVQGGQDPGHDAAVEGGEGHGVAEDVLLDGHIQLGVEGLEEVSKVGVVRSEGAAEVAEGHPGMSGGRGGAAAGDGHMDQVGRVGLVVKVTSDDDVGHGQRKNFSRI